MKTPSYKQRIWKWPKTAISLFLCLFLWALLPQAQQAHPDKVYPIPQNYLSVNRAGVNLLSGDLNLDMPLASISGHQLSYSLEVFYNSRSADLGTVNNSMGGRGWKLLDYPKIVQDGATYHYLDGQRSYPLAALQGSQYTTGAPYHLWRFHKEGTIWTLTDESGVQYELGNQELGSYTIWHLSRTHDPAWGDTLSFTYEGGRLMAITSDLGDQLLLRYNASDRITAVEVYGDRQVEGEDAELYSTVRTNYDAYGRLTTIQTQERLTNMTTEELPGIQFTYDPQGRIAKTISPSGAVQSYVYYSGNNQGIRGCVIRFSTDNGYAKDVGDDKEPSDHNVEDTYSALWYDLGNDQTNGVYRAFNKVRVYPGGFYEDLNDIETEGDGIYNPFGHENYFFFNGAGFSTLQDLPDPYTSSTNVTHTSLRGFTYRMESYADDGLMEYEEDRISEQQYIYTFTSFQSKQIPLLTQVVFSEDGVDDQTTWYQYNNMTLPSETTYARRNPTREDADRREYDRVQQHYAYEDHPDLLSYNLLTPVSQVNSATATFTGSTLPTNASLRWQVTEASITGWKQWPNSAGHGWAAFESYVLRESIEPSMLPMDPSTVSNSDRWLKIGETVELSSNGQSLSSQDVDGIARSVIYDNTHGFYPVASFDHANALDGEAGYLGLEQYEANDDWSVSGGNISREDAHTGIHAYGGSGSIKIEKNYVPRDEKPYVLGAFVKNRSGSTGTLGFKEGGSWRASASIPANSDWQYISVILENPSSSKKPTIECNNCLVDDIRFHPIDAAFSATVYWGREVEDDDLTITQAGDHQVNSTITVDAGLQLSANTSLRMHAQDAILFKQGVSISSETGVSLSASLADFSTRMDKPVATLGANGETYRQVYDALYEPIALVGPNETLRGVNTVYNSQQGMEYFGDSETNDPHFDGNYPNMHMQVMARGGGVWESFEDNAHFTSLNGMTLVGGHLETHATGSGAAAEYGQTLSATDYALYVELLPQDIAIDQEMGLKVGGQVSFLLTGSKLQLKSGGSELASVSLIKAPDHLNLLLVVMDGKHVFAYANGRFLFDHTFGSEVLGSVELVSTNPGGAFDNFMYLQDPLIGKQTYDALGQPKQSLIHQAPDKLIVSETLYGDHLNLPMAATRVTHIDTDSSTKGLAFREGFANLNYTGTTVTTTGEVKDKHGYNTPFVTSHTYKNDPTLRADRMGSSGAFTAGTSNSVDNDYTASDASNAFGFGEDDLRNVQEKAPYENNKDLYEETYEGTATGTVFASTVTDPNDGKSQSQQVVYDEQMRPRRHYQPNAFDTSISGHDAYYTETGYDFLGNLVLERDPDEGITMHAYGPTYRHRLTLDAGDVNGPYYRYWKYDTLGRVIEEGLYDDQGTERDRTVDPQGLAGETTETAIATLTVSSGEFTGTSLNLRAGVSITMEPGFVVDATQGHEMDAELVDDVLQKVFSTELADPQWPVDGKAKRTYTYDEDAQNPQNKAIGRLVAITTYDEEGDTNASNTEQYVYDLEGRAVTHSLSIKEGTQTHLAVTHYGYDLLGQTTTIQSDTDASTHDVAYDVVYSYDRSGRVSGIGNSSDKEAYATYAYENDLLTEKLSKDGGSYTIVNNYTRNKEGYLASIESVVNGEREFFEELYYTKRKDGSAGYYNGNIASASHSYFGGDYTKDNDYHYDGFGRLIKKTGQSSLDYSYDANGNFQGPSYQYQSGSNRLENYGGGGLQYDISGRTLSRNGLNFTYDRFTDLTKSIYNSNSNQTLTFWYGSRGQRISKAVRDANETEVRKVRYLHGLNDYPLIELEDTPNGDATVQYIYGPTGLIALSPEGITAVSGANGTTVTFDSWHYVIKDHLGSVRQVRHGQGGLVNEFGYGPFGETWEINYLLVRMPMHYHYTGQEYDEEVGLYNYRARMYDPGLGRFLTPDPLAQQNSPYAYAGNNPISFTDPTGEWFFFDDLFAMTVGAIVGAGMELVSQAVSGDGINWGKVGVAAVAGAAAGEADLYGGPLAGGAVHGAVDKMGNNLLEGKRGWEAFDGVAESAAMGAATAGVMHAAGKLASKGLSYVKGKLGSRAGKLLNKVGCGCFTEGTQVKTEKGYRNVEDITTDDKVWAFNEATGEQTLKPVVDTFGLFREATYTVYVDGKALEASSDHPFYTGSQWVEAKDLRPTDSLQLFSGATAAIDSITFTAGYTKVYNFEVADLHNYYVGEEDGVLVHNTKACRLSRSRAAKSKSPYKAARKSSRRGKVVQRLEPGGKSKPYLEKIPGTNKKGLVPVTGSYEKKVKITYTGARGTDFTAADKAVGITAKYRQGNKLVWHHYHDYNSATNRGTMYLMKHITHTPGHGGPLHYGGAWQFKQAHGWGY